MVSIVTSDEITSGWKKWKISYSLGDFFQPIKVGLMWEFNSIQFMRMNTLQSKSYAPSSTLSSFHIRCCCFCFAHSTFYVHETEETYTATQLNLAKLAKEPSATYQIRLWSQGGTKVNRPHHGDILLRSPPWFGIETKRNNLVSCTNPATSWSLCIWEVTQRRNIRQANQE